VKSQGHHPAAADRQDGTVDVEPLLAAFDDSPPAQAPICQAPAA